MSFTEMFGCGYFGVHKKTSVSAVVQRQASTDGSIQSHHQQCTMFCHGLKNFNKKGMGNVTSDTNYAYRRAS